LRSATASIRRGSKEGHGSGHHQHQDFHLHVFTIGGVEDSSGRTGKQALSSDSDNPEIRQMVSRRTTSAVCALAGLGVISSTIERAKARSLRLVVLRMSRNIRGLIFNSPTFFLVESLIFIKHLILLKLAEREMHHQ